MTTKPKAKKFRIRRAGSPAPSTDAAPQSEAVQHSAPAAPQAAPQTTPRPEPAASGAGQQPPETAPVAEGGDQAADAEALDTIRKEGLTGRQLRLARRVAQRHGIAATSDFDAVRQLRARGIDPFQRSNMLELVVGKQDGEDDGAPVPETRIATRPAQTQPAQTSDGPTRNLPAHINPAERRAAEIRKVQLDIAKRRRKRQALLVTRLAFFVFLPTFLASWYFYVIATPMYATTSAFFILKAEDSGGVGSFFSGTQFATNQDAFAVQSYLTSKDAMLQLDEDAGFISHFSSPEIDAVQRLSPTASPEDAYDVYKSNVIIGFDPTEGVIRMEVIAADPETSALFSNVLIRYAERRLDELTQMKRVSAVRDAEEGLTHAAEGRLEAQEKLVRMQQEGSIVDPEGRIAALRGQITTFDTQIQEKRLELRAQLDNRRPNQAKVDGLQGDIRRLEALLAELNAEMTTATSGEESLAELAVQVQLAQADLATRDLMLQSALERLEQARRDADTQARYLTTSVKPVPPQDPTYPRAFENTILAFLIFSGIYLVLSITASILREQVTA